LDSPRFPRREEASRRLAGFGEEAEPILRQALAEKPSAEARQRLERILAGPRRVRSPELLRSLRALQILEAIGAEPASNSASWLRERPPPASPGKPGRPWTDWLTVKNVADGTIRTSCARRSATPRSFASRRKARRTHRPAQPASACRTSAGWALA